ncbi:MAG TPA: hypothetical protein VJ793_09980 [Anaerolineae bacterium]|nr:hypothetical protein [Anaerolineae bacterium]
MEHTSPTTDRPLRIPRIAWIVGAGLLAALVAVAIFNVPLNTVVYYGFIVLVIVGHLFMHGGHGSHGGHGQHTDTAQTTDTATTTNDTVAATRPDDQHTRHSGGCH